MALGGLSPHRRDREVSPGGSHLGAGGTPLSGAPGLASFTLGTRTERWWHVPEAGGSCSPGGATRARGPSGTGHSRHLRSCQGGQRDLGDPWDPRGQEGGLRGLR